MSAAEEIANAEKSLWAAKEALQRAVRAIDHRTSPDVGAACDIAGELDLFADHVFSLVFRARGARAYVNELFGEIGSSR